MLPAYCLPGQYSILTTISSYIRVRGFRSSPPAFILLAEDDAQFRFLAMIIISSRWCSRHTRMPIYRHRYDRAAGSATSTGTRRPWPSQHGFITYNAAAHVFATTPRYLHPKKPAKFYKFSHYCRVISIQEALPSPPPRKFRRVSACYFRWPLFWNAP